MVSVPSVLDSDNHALYGCKLLISSINLQHKIQRFGTVSL